MESVSMDFPTGDLLQLEWQRWRSIKRDYGWHFDGWWIQSPATARLLWLWQNAGRLLWHHCHYVLYHFGRREYETYAPVPLSSVLFQSHYLCPSLYLICQYALEINLPYQYFWPSLCYYFATQAPYLLQHSRKTINNYGLKITGVMDIPCRQTPKPKPGTVIIFSFYLPAVLSASIVDSVMNEHTSRLFATHRIWYILFSFLSGTHFFLILFFLSHYYDTSSSSL